MRRTTLLAVVAASLTGVGFAIVSVRMDEDTKIKPRHGKLLYMELCASCHGVNLEGQANWRRTNANGRLPAPPHDETGHTWHHGDDQLFRITKTGIQAVVGNGYQSDMPSFQDVLNDTEIRRVITYIKSTWPAHIRKRHDLINRRRRK